MNGLIASQHATMNSLVLAHIGAVLSVDDYGSESGRVPPVATSPKGKERDLLSLRTLSTTKGNDTTPSTLGTPDARPQALELNDLAVIHE